jgi:hypothetical protein
MHLILCACSSLTPPTSPFMVWPGWEETTNRPRENLKQTRQGLISSRSQSRLSKEMFCIILPSEPARFYPTVSILNPSNRPKPDSSLLLTDVVQSFRAATSVWHNGYTVILRRRLPTTQGQKKRGKGGGVAVFPVYSNPNPNNFVQRIPASLPIPSFYLNDRNSKKLLLCPASLSESFALFKNSICCRTAL